MDKGMRQSGMMALITKNADVGQMEEFLGRSKHSRGAVTTIRSAEDGQK